MKIAIVISQFEIEKGGATGGAMGVAYNEAQQLQRAGHQVFVFSGAKKGAFLDQKSFDFHLHQIPIQDSRWVFHSYLSLFNCRIEKGFKKLERVLQ